MVILTKPFGILFLLIGSVVHGQTVDDDDDDDGFQHGGLCYYDDTCLFACVEVESPEECLNYVFTGPVAGPPSRKLGESSGMNQRMQGLLEYLNRDRHLQQLIPFDVPYYRANVGGNCQPTSENPKPIGVCCPSCEEADLDSCTDFYVNPDGCEQTGLNYFLDVIQEFRTDTHVGACSSVDSGGGTDPHIKTFSGHWFDYMGECDMVFLNVPDFEHGLALDIHVRSTIRYDYSYFEEVALRIGEDVLIVRSFGAYSLNGVGNADLAGVDFAGYPIYHRQVSEKQHDFDILTGKNEKITISTFKDLVTIHLIGATKDHFGDAKGLMGTFDGQMVARNGTIVTPQPEGDESIINAYAQTWQVQENEDVLFETVRSPLAGEKCLLPSVTQAEKRRRLGESLSVETAQRACVHLSGKAKDNCVFDVLAVGDVDIATAGAY